MASETHLAVGALRERRIEDMRVRGFVEKTRNDDVRHVRACAAFLGRPPDTATAEGLRRFQLKQIADGVGTPTVDATVSALRFLFTRTLDRPDLVRRLAVGRKVRRVPEVLSPEEVARLLEAAPNPRYKAAMATAYGAGLRATEMVSPKVTDIDSTRMMLRVEQGQGRRGPLRHAVAPAPDALARLVAGGAPAGRDAAGRLALSRDGADGADRSRERPYRLSASYRGRLPTAGQEGLKAAEWRGSLAAGMMIAQGR